ncbi:hypothetical protein INR49_014112 [Caranx melampygus]|nr:hypothetical protein INR49_014112 [Caranx melampygus]
MGAVTRSLGVQVQANAPSIAVWFEQELSEELPQMNRLTRTGRICLRPKLLTACATEQQHVVMKGLEKEKKKKDMKAYFSHHHALHLLQRALLLLALQPRRESLLLAVNDGALLRFFPGAHFRKPSVLFLLSSRLRWDARCYLRREVQQTEGTLKSVSSQATVTEPPARGLGPSQAFWCFEFDMLRRSVNGLIGPPGSLRLLSVPSCLFFCGEAKGDEINPDHKKFDIS